jgi:hypothetical protein
LAASIAGLNSSTRVRFVMSGFPTAKFPVCSVYHGEVEA